MSLMTPLCALIVATFSLHALTITANETGNPPAAKTESAVAAELERLAGDWVGDYSLRQARTWKVSFTEGTFHAEVPGKEFYSGTIEIDPTATPARIDFVITEGSGAARGDVCQAIYRWEGDDHLVLQTPNLGQAPPADFSGEEHDYLFLRRASLP